MNTLHPVSAEIQKSSGLSQENRLKASQVMARVLADEVVLLNITRNYHWHVTGPNFKGLHELFEEHYRALFEAIDESAERIRMLGFTAPATMEEYSELTRLEEKPMTQGELPDANEILDHLIAANEQVARQLLEAIQSLEGTGDEGTIDMCVQKVQVHEKNAWFLRASKNS